LRGKAKKSDQGLKEPLKKPFEKKPGKKGEERHASLSVGKSRSVIQRKKKQKGKDGAGRDGAKAGAIKTCEKGTVCKNPQREGKKIQLKRDKGDSTKNGPNGQSGKLKGEDRGTKKI